MYLGQTLRYMARLLIIDCIIYYHPIHRLL